MNESLNHLLVNHTNSWFAQKPSKPLWMSHWIIDSWFIQTADSFRYQASTYEWVAESLTRDSNKQLIHSETKQALMNESLNHWLVIHTNSWFIQKPSKPLWMSHWIIDSWFIQTADSFRNQDLMNESLNHWLMIHTNSWFIQKPSKPLWMNHWIIDSWFIQTADSFRNQASPYEWITESLTRDSYKQLIHSETKQALMNESLNHRLVIHTNSWFILNPSKPLWISHWIIDSWFIQTADSFRNQASPLWMSHWIIDSWFIQTADSFRNQASPYEWVTESLTRDSYKQLIHSETKQALMNESLNHRLVIHTNSWFIQKPSKPLWMSHWIIDSWFIQTADSFRNQASPYERVTESLTHDSYKQLIHSETKQGLMNESLNHRLVIHTNSWFIQKPSKPLWMSHWIIDSWFIQTADSFRNQASDWIID